MALSLGSANAAPTPITEGRRGRKTKSIEEQVAEADKEPYAPSSAFAVAAEDEDPDENSYIADLMQEDPDGDPGEIAMDPEQRAEFEARARKGLGGTQEAAESPARFATDYDANGEAIDVEIAPRSPQQPSTPTVIENQYVMPMFEALRMDKLVLNVAGRVEVNYALDGDRKLWDSLRPGNVVEFVVTALVPSRGPRIKFDSEREISEKAGVAAAKVVEVRPLETEFRQQIIRIDPAENLQSLINWAHQILGDEFFTEEDWLPDTLAFFRAVADLGEPTDAAPAQGPTPSEVADDNPVASALDDALAAALEGDPDSDEE